MRTSTVFLITSLMFPLPIWAADASGSFSIRGAGLLSCETYVKERAVGSKAYYMIGGWIDGYITGINQYASDTYNATSFEDTELLATIVQDHCKVHPQDRLFPVVNSILIKLKDARIKTASLMVEVVVGEHKTTLYAEVVRRIQTRLQSLGYYKEAPGVSWNDATRSAIAEFQKGKGLAETGFPDQVTLWRLLRQDDREKP